MGRWTQPLCDDCWDARRPESPSPRASAGAPERCAYCGEHTVSGIYVRDDPAQVPYPREDTPNG